MTQQVRTSYRNHRKGAWAAVLVVLVAAALVLVVLPASAGNGDASASGVQPVEVPLGGSSGDCKYSTSPGPSAGEYEYIINNPKTEKREVTVDGRTITFEMKVYGTKDIYTSSGDFYFWFKATGASVFDVVVNGGQKSTWFDYDVLPAGPTNNDWNLHAPTKGNGSNLYNLSHVTFCFSLSGVSGTVWEDSNENTTFSQPADVNEQRQSGWTVHLHDVGSNTTVSTTTGTNGGYSFPDAVIGRHYVICEEKPADDEGSWTQTVPTTTPALCDGLQEERGHDITSLAIGQKANFGNVPTVTADCNNPTGLDNYEFLVACKFDGEEFVVTNFTNAAGQSVANLHPVGTLSGDPEPIVEKITWEFDGTNQNPVEIWYDDTPDEVPPYTTYQKMQLCISDPIDPAGATDLTLLDPLPGDLLPEGETSCLVRSIDIAGGMYVAYVYTTFDGGRLGVT